MRVAFCDETRRSKDRGILWSEARPLKKREEDAALESLANVGAEVAGRLREAGIRTPAELRRLGSAEAAARMARARPDDPPCRSMLSGLEGAIRGLRWHAIPKEERERIWEEYQRVVQTQEEA
jgi:DNA transformation protein and related proteins